MIFVKTTNKNNDWKQIRSSNILNHINENQLKALGQIRTLAHNLCFTDSYRIKLFDIYVSDYICAVIFEIRNVANNQYIRKMRGQVFIDQYGNIYFYDDNHVKQDITTSLFPSVKKE